MQKLRRGKPLPGIQDKTIIIVDDGIATGATLFATIELFKKKKAGKIVVASPIAGKQMEDVLRNIVVPEDEIISHSNTRKDNSSAISIILKLLLNSRRSIITGF